MTSSDREPNRVPFRAGAMLLVAIAVVCIGLGWHSAVSGSESGAAELASSGTGPVSTTAGPSASSGSGVSGSTSAGPSSGAGTSGSSTDPSASAANANAPELCVLNAGSTAGLAQEVDQTLRAKGWRTSAPGNLRSASITENTVFYTASQRATAQRVAADLGGDTSTDPRPAAFSECADGIAVVVVNR